MILVDIFSKKFPISSLFIKVQTLVVHEVVHLHSLRKSTISKIFNSYFWRNPSAFLGNKHKIPITFHLQTDGQTNVFHKHFGNLLWALIWDNFKSWDLILLQADFVNHISSISPSEILHCYYPKSIDLFLISKYVCVGRI